MHKKAMTIRKRLAHDIRVKKNPQTKEDNFWIADFYGVMRAQISTCPPVRKFHQWRC